MESIIHKVNGPLKSQLPVALTQDKRENSTREPYIEFATLISGLDPWVLGHQWAWACVVIVFGWIGVCLECFGWILVGLAKFDEWWGPL